MVTRLTLLCFGLLIGLAHGHESEDVSLVRVSAEIAREPTQATLYVQRAALYLERRDWQACLVDLERAERGRASNLAMMRARALLLGHHASSALALIEDHLSQHPGDVQAWMLQARAHASLEHWTAAAQSWGQALGLMPKPEPDHLVEAAEAFVRAGRGDEALRWLDRAPMLTVTVERAVEIEMRAGRSDAALRRMDALIEASRVKEPLLAKRASLLAQAGRVDDSIQAWESLLKQIASMPPQARGSHAMSKLMLQAQQALASLRGTIATRSP